MLDKETALLQQTLTVATVVVRHCSTNFLRSRKESLCEQIRRTEISESIKGILPNFKKRCKFGGLRKKLIRKKMSFSANF